MMMMMMMMDDGEENDDEEDDNEEEEEEDDDLFPVAEEDCLEGGANIHIFALSVVFFLLNLIVFAVC